MTLDLSKLEYVILTGTTRWPKAGARWFCPSTGF